MIICYIDYCRLLFSPIKINEIENLWRKKKKIDLEVRISEEISCCQCKCGSSVKNVKSLSGPSFPRPSRRPVRFLNRDIHRENFRKYFREQTRFLCTGPLCSVWLFDNRRSSCCLVISRRLSRSQPSDDGVDVRAAPRSCVYTRRTVLRGKPSHSTCNRWTFTSNFALWLSTRALSCQ